MLFHTHQWDAYTERQAAALAARSRGLDFYVLANETDGEVPVRGFRKIAHTMQGFVDQGLPPDRGMWWNLDYALYQAAAVLPDYEFYFRFDADVRLTVDLADIAAWMRRAACDWLTLRPRGVETWAFRASAEALPYRRRAYVPMMAMLLSAAALRLLESDRRMLARRRVAGERWAICECFIAAALLEHGVRIGRLEDLAQTGLFRAELALLETDERLAEPGGIFHAVLDLPRYVRKLERSARYALQADAPTELARMREIAIRHDVRQQFAIALMRAQSGRRYAATPSCPEGSRPTRPASAEPA